MSSQNYGMSVAINNDSVTCHPTQVNMPRLNSSQTGWYLIYLPWLDERLSWPRWLVTYWSGLLYLPTDGHPSKYHKRTSQGSWGAAVPRLGQTHYFSGKS